MFKSYLAGAGDNVPHTPTADRMAGFIVVQGSFVGCCTSDLKANVPGNVKCGGVDYFAQDTVAPSDKAVGDIVYLNATQTPTPFQSVNKLSTGGNLKLGVVVKAALAAEMFVLVAWNRCVA